MIRAPKNILGGHKNAVSKINIPIEVEKIINDLQNENFEAYIVGGCVRDNILGIEPKDWDIATNAKPEQIKKIFAKTVDTGLAHGTVTVILNKKHFEVTTYRIDGEYKDCRRPENVFFTDDLLQDLSRRDFTMNAIAFNQKYIDPFNGLQDIKNKLIRCVGNPAERFREDALRMMRAIRFANQLNFDLESKTFAALKKNVELIKFVSIERIRDELVKLFFSDARKINLLNESKILQFVNYDFYKYLCDNLNEISKKLLRVKKSCDTIFSVILYKMKPKDAYSLMKFFRFANKTCDSVRKILTYLNVKISNAYDVKKVICAIGYENFYKLLDVRNALEIFDNAKDILQNISGDCIFIKDLAVSGNDIKFLGFSGKEIGNVLKYLLDIVHKFPEKNSFDELISLAAMMK